MTSRSRKLLRTRRGSIACFFLSRKVSRRVNFFSLGVVDGLELILPVEEITGANENDAT